MVSIPLGKTDWRRPVSRENAVLVRNRYFEQNPTNLVDQVAMIARPGLKRYLQVGNGPIRSIYSQPGSFSDAMFVISDDHLFRVDVDETITDIGGGFFGAGLNAFPSMTATARLGSTPEYLFIADGRNLWVYDGTTLSQVAMPDDVGAVSVAFIASYVVVVVAQGFDMNGRFYWINPGEIIVDPLNFATAEQAPDPVYSCRAVGDRIWFFGPNSTEVWYPSGDATAPFLRSQGTAFNRGTWGGTDVKLKDDVIITDSDGIVYRITGAGPQRISDNSIEERIREAMRTATADPIQ